MVETGAIVGVADIHAGTLADRFKAFEDLDGLSVVFRGGKG
tara:strand:- start:451 stop:573 length:123 start_codon:yes stop_codon:yes gene_type:complete